MRVVPGLYCQITTFIAVMPASLSGISHILTLA